MTSHRHVTEIREHMVEIRKCCNVCEIKVGFKDATDGNENSHSFDLLPQINCRMLI